MSLKDHKGTAWAFAQLMAESKREIEAGERKGATTLHAKPNPAKTHIGWFKRRLLRGEFRRRA